MFCVCVRLCVCVCVRLCVCVCVCVCVGCVRMCGCAAAIHNNVIPRQGRAPDVTCNYHCICTSSEEYLACMH